jgi:hypothetical protein
MSDMILNANDPNFKNLMSKLISAGWVEKNVDIPKTATAKRNVEVFWTKKGQLSILTIKRQLKDCPLWDQANAFALSLNEQEEAFFHSNVLAAVPD